MQSKELTTTGASAPQRAFVAAVACVLTIACDSAAGPSSRSEYQLLFVSAEGGVDYLSIPNGPGEDIYRMNANGTGRQNLTNQSTYETSTGTLRVEYRSLALSPDGRTIAFESTSEGCPGIWGMNIDGSGVRKLSIGQYMVTRCNQLPVWSPDGNHIAFTTSREGKWSLYIMNADGTNPHNVAPSLDDGPGSFLWATGWAPDGRVVFRDGGLQGYIVNTDGTNPELLFGQTGDHSAEWSPDRAKVAFIHITASGSNLFVLNADGTDVRQLTNHPGLDEFWGDWTNDYDRWSPDGKRIVFSNVIDGRSELHVIDADGTNEVQLTNYTADFNGWAPDGRITFNSAVTGSQDIYLINPDGTGRVNLTNTPNSQEQRGLWVRTEPGS
jgi:Tol biopolymer transport system component